MPELRPKAVGSRRPSETGSARASSPERPAHELSEKERRRLEKESKKAEKRAKKEKEKAGEPDRDDAFLKAVATTKRGKKTEDSFDREFNNLRISKPDLERGREDEEWKVLEDFGDDGDMRGNFMVVVEMPLYRDPGAGSREHLRRGEGRMEWQGRPDFKKFRRVSGSRELYSMR